MRIEAVQLRHGWNRNQFGFDATLIEGGILLSGAAGDREGLPPGPYDVTVEVESYTFKNAHNRILVKEGSRTVIVMQVKPETRVITLKDNFDAATQAVIDASTIDDKPMLNWLSGSVRPKPRVQRRACALNILSRLAAPPALKVKAGLNRAFETVHFADVDRIYGTAAPELHATLESFVHADTWKGEGPPGHPIHKRLVFDAIKRFPEELGDKTERDFNLLSYRQGGRNGMQVVVAIPKFEHPVIYAEVDIDLGNPLWDLEGVFVHLGELLDGGPTDHFKVREKLGDMLAPEFIFYTVKDS
jgi:hypothetical protein